MSLTIRRNICRSAIKACKRKEDPEPEPKPFEQIPGPKPLPIIGNIWRYFPIVGSYSLKTIHLTYAKMYEEFGPLVREEVHKDRTLVHAFDPRDMMKVYRNEGKFPSRLSHRAVGRYRLERPLTYDGPGLPASNGEEWYRFRHLFQKTLMAGPTAEKCSNILEDVTEDLLKRIETELDSRREMDIFPLLFKWALECVGAVTLNKRLQCLSTNGYKEAARLIKAANDIHTMVFLTENTTLNYQKNYRKLEKAQEFLERVVKKYMEEGIKEIEKGNDTESVLCTFHKDETIGKKAMFTMILDMFLAGIDTTTSTLAFTLYNLATNPSVQDKLRIELVEQLPQVTSRVTDKKGRLRYLNQVILESQRINPAAIGSGRVTPVDLELSGYRVPAETTIILQHQVAGMQADYFPDPRCFKPERWIDGTSPASVCSPFGHGPRMCIGMRIARKELQISIARIARTFKLSYHHEPIGTYNKLINVPDKPVRLRFGPVDA